MILERGDCVTRFQKVICTLMSVIFLAVLCSIPDPKWIWGNLYRQLPFYCFLENRIQTDVHRTDKWTSELIIKGNARYLSEQVMSEAVKVVGEEVQVNVEPQLEMEPQIGMGTEFQAEIISQVELESQVEVEPQVDVEAQIGVEPQVKLTESITEQLQPQPILDLSLERLSDMQYLLGNFFIVDSQTDAGAANLNAAEFLGKDLTIQKDESVPQILIYHSHSQEAFSDSREGVKKDTIVGVGAYLKKLLEKRYGYQVIHVKEAFDMKKGYLDRSAAYDYARTHVEKILEENPSIEVVIDLHRDGVAENRHLVTTINGKDTAQIMFYNGLSYTNSYGQVDYLPNPYIQDNLAFSFQLEYQAAMYYPELYRGIYLAGLRYNLHLKPRALLLEAGAQTNTVQEVKNAMEPFAHILHLVLEGNGV